jgi:hypothetical protein
MKSYGLFVITLLTLAVTGAVITQAAPIKRTVVVRPGECRSTGKAYDPLQSQEAQRWRRADPHHWRDVMLHQ